MYFQIKKEILGKFSVVFFKAFSKKKKKIFGGPYIKEKDSFSFLPLEEKEEFCGVNRKKAVVFLDSRIEEIKNVS